MSTESISAYDKWHRQMETHAEDADPMAFEWYRSAYSGIKHGLSGHLLEIGCGRGSFAIWLVNTVPHVRVTGVDFSSSAIKIAKKRAARCGNYAQFVAGDAQRLAFSDNTFDWIVSCECMEHVPQPQVMAGEMFRVLKPGGRFCLTTENYLNGLLLSWLHSWVTGRPFDSGSGVQPIEKFFLFPMVQRYLQRAGLLVERSESTHYQWLLLPRVDPARLCTKQLEAGWARSLSKPFGRHFSFFGSKPDA